MSWLITICQCCYGGRGLMGRAWTPAVLAVGSALVIAAAVLAVYFVGSGDVDHPARRPYIDTATPAWLAPRP